MKLLWRLQKEKWRNPCGSPKTLRPFLPESRFRVNPAKTCAKFVSSSWALSIDLRNNFRSILTADSCTKTTLELEVKRRTSGHERGPRNPDNMSGGSAPCHKLRPSKHVSGGPCAVLYARKQNNSIPLPGSFPQTGKIFQKNEQQTIR